MPRGRNPKVDQAEALFIKGKKLIDIAKRLELPEGTVRRWKSTYGWDNERPKNEANVRNKSGAPKGNKNAVGDGAPLKNKNAEKHGLFSKYLPAETLDIINQMPKDPLDVLWDQIQIAYAAIIRSQQIMHVKDWNDKTVERSKISKTDNSVLVENEIQQAWDKQANFLQAQARAMTSLNGMVKNYDDLLHKNWDLASEEQRARIENIKAGTAKIKGEDQEDNPESDGFLEALRGEASGVWEE